MSGKFYRWKFLCDESCRLNFDGFLNSSFLTQGANFGASEAKHLEHVFPKLGINFWLYRSEWSISTEY